MDFNNEVPEDKVNFSEMFPIDAMSMAQEIIEVMSNYPESSKNGDDYCKANMAIIPIIRKYHKESINCTWKHIQPFLDISPDVIAELEKISLKAMYRYSAHCYITLVIDRIIEYFKNKNSSNK